MQRLICLLSLAALALAIPARASAEQVLQRLDVARSDISFNAAAGEIGAEGNFKDFSGQLLFDLENVRRSAIVFQIDLSQVSFAPMPPGNLFLFQNLLRTIPDPLVRFKSTGIEPAGTGRLRVSGILSANNRQESITIPVEVVEMFSNRSVMRGRITRSSLPGPGGTAGPPLAVDGAVVFRLLFTRR